MTANDPFVQTIIDTPSPADAWSAIFGSLKALATVSSSPVELHNKTRTPDRVLSECAWELWKSYHITAGRTSQAIVQWWSKQSGSLGKAVLVLDALSLRELAPLLGGADARGIVPTNIMVTGSELPSDTDQFAKALGVSSRGSLKNNAAPGGFALTNGGVYTDVLSYPFGDCLGSVPSENNIFLWHTWLDDLIHVHKKLPDQIYKLASEGLQSNGFWEFVNRLRQGRKLLITADHGYAVAKLFSTEEKDAQVVQALRDVFGASRRKTDSRPWNHCFMPPIVITENSHHVIMGQRKWKVQGGFPHVDHGGLTLLEVAVPFVELPPL